jgi:hypothetical protein
MPLRRVAVSLLFAWLLCGAGDAALEHARVVNLAYSRAMPGFVADETAARYSSPPGSSRWQHLDTIESEITFSGPRAVRRQIRRNGKPWDQPFEALPGYKWYGGFGTEIRPVFDPGCPTTLEYQGASRLGGHPVRQYAFRSPADGCFAFFFSAGLRANPPRTGHVFLQDPGGNVLRFDEEASGFPAGFDFTQRKEEVTWDSVKIGEASHMLPVAARFEIFYASGTRTRIEVRYRNHRHFEASSNIQFQK